MVTNYSDITEEKFKEILQSGNSIERIKCMLVNGFDKDMIIDECYTPLTLSLTEKKYDIVEFLVNEGADVNKVDNFAFLPLEYAIENFSMVKFLVERGADINMIHEHVSEFNPRGTFKETPLCSAVFSDITTMRYLIENGGKVNIIENGASVSPIFGACLEGTLDMVMFLVTECGVDVNAIEEWNSSPLSLACFSNNYEKVKFLLEKGANVNKTWSGKLNEYYNSECEDDRILKILTDYKIYLAPKNY